MKLKLNEISCISNRDEGDLGSLIEAIKATGERLLQPIILADGKNGTKLYEVVDGRRRFMALKLMGRTELHPEEYNIIDSAVDGEAAAYIANTERKMLTPLEEANQICAMLKQMTAEEIAEKLGKTLNYVVSRSRLAELKGAWRQVLAEPDKFPHWTIGKLQLIAREPKETQKEIEHLIRRTQTLTELRESIQYYHRKLSTAPFKWQNICRICQKRSDHQGVLFAEDKAEATCLDKDCFEKQCLNAVKKKLQENPKLKMVRSSGGTYMGEAEKFANKNKVPANWQVDYKEVTDPAEADAIVCCGDKIGKFVKITRRSGSAAPVKTSADKVAEAAAEKAKKAETKKQRDILRIAMVNFFEQVKIMTEWSKIPEELHNNIWRLILGIGISDGSIWHYEYLRQADPIDGSSWQDMLLTRCISRICDHINGTITNPQLDVNWNFGKEVCKAFDWDWEELFLNPAKLEYEKGK
jgi:ParB/RepB/Spo0J family partition protein